MIFFFYCLDFQEKKDNKRDLLTSPWSFWNSINLDCDLFVGQFNFENVSFPAIVTLTILCLAFKVSEAIIKFSW